MTYVSPEANRRSSRKYYRRMAQDPEWVERHRESARLWARKQTYIYDAAAAAAKSANKAAVRAGVSGRLTKADIEALWQRQPVCVCCGEGRGVDHIKALTNGGSNTPDNIQTLCQPCNSRKADSDVMPARPVASLATHCAQGHLRADNTVMRGRGRYCRPCLAARDAARYQQKKEASRAA